MEVVFPFHCLAAAGVPVGPRIDVWRRMRLSKPHAWKRIVYWQFSSVLELLRAKAGLSYLYV